MKLIRFSFAFMCVLLLAVGCNRVAVKPAATQPISTESEAEMKAPRLENDYLVFETEKDMLIFMHHLHDMSNEDRTAWEKSLGFASLQSAYQAFSRYSEASAEKGYGMTIPELRAKHPYIIMENDGTFEENCTYPLLSYICNVKGMVKIGNVMQNYTKGSKDMLATTNNAANKIESSTCKTPLNVNVGAWYGSAGYTSIVPEREWTDCGDKFKLKASCDNYQTAPAQGTGQPVYDELTISMKSYKRNLGIYFPFSTNLSTNYSGSMESGPTSPATYTHTIPFTSKFINNTNSAVFVVRTNYNGASSSSPSYLPVFPIGPETWQEICIDATVSYITSGSGSCGTVPHDLL